MDDGLFYLFQGNLDDPAYVWAALWEEFEPASAVARTELLERFHSLELHQFDNFGLYAAEISRVCGRLHMLKAEPSDEVKLTRLLIGLGEGEDFKLYRISLSLERDITFRKAVLQIKKGLRFTSFGKKTQSSASSRQTAYNVSRSQSVKTCFNYQKGSCTRSNCRFSHVGPVVDSKVRRSKPASRSVKCYFCEGAHKVRACEKLQKLKANQVQELEDVTAEDREFAWMLQEVPEQVVELEAVDVDVDLPEDLPDLMSSSDEVVMKTQRGRV